MTLQHLICIGIAAAASCLAARPAPAAPVDDLIPAEVALAVVTDDLAATASAWDQTRWGGALAGQTFNPLVQELRSRDLSAPLHLRPWFGVDWKELANWHAPAAFIVYGDEKESHAACLFACGAAEDSAPLLAAMNQYLAAKRFKSTESVVSGYRVVAFRPPAGGGKNSGPASVAKDHLFAIASSQSAAVKLATTLGAGTFKSLDSVNEYRESTAIAAEPNEAHRIRFWVRPLPLWTLARSREASKPRPDWLAITQRQGFEAVRSVSGVAEFSEAGGSEIDVRATVAIASPLTKAARLLDLKTGPGAAIPSWLCADFASLSLWQCDFPEAISAFGGIFDELAEPGPTGQGLFKDLLDGLRDDPEGPRVDLRREVFPHLGPQMLSVVDRSAPVEKATDTPSRNLLVIQCRNAAAVKEALTRFYKSDTEVRREDVGADPLWTIGPGKSLFVEGGGDTQMPIRAVLATPDALLAASHPEMITGRVQAAELAPQRGAAFRRWSDWQSGTATDKTGYRSLVMEGPWLETPYTRVRSGKAVDEESWQVRALRFLLWGSASPRPMVNHGALPEWSAVRDALDATGLTLEPSPPGYLLRGGVSRETPMNP